MAYENVPPHNSDAEMALLGCMLLDDDVAEDIIASVNSDDFYKQWHSCLFEIMCTMKSKNIVLDMVTVAEYSSRMKLVDKVGGLGYIALLTNICPTTLNYRHYLRIVNETSVARKVIAASKEITEMAYQPMSEDMNNILGRAEKKFEDIASKNVDKGYYSLNKLVTGNIERLSAIASKKKDILGISTGLKNIDRVISGLNESDLIILAARPSMGKTALALNIALNVAFNKDDDEKKSVAIFSLEMSAEQLVMRMTNSYCGIDSNKVNSGTLSDKEWDVVMKGSSLLFDAPIYIDDTPGINFLELRSKARNIKTKHGLNLIIVDYIQLMQGMGKSSTRQEQISEISRGLKLIARELNVPVIALSQLNRSVENRQDKRPMMSDLRESGAIEQDADIVMFLYRDDYYNSLQNSDDSIPSNYSSTELIIAKHRNGPTGNVPLLFIKNLTKFVDADMS